jgi:hypothetical protein
VMLLGGCRKETELPIGVKSQPLNCLEEPLPQEPSEPVGAIPASIEERGPFIFPRTRIVVIAVAASRKRCWV